MPYMLFLRLVSYVLFAFERGVKMTVMNVSKNSLVGVFYKK